MTMSLAFEGLGAFVREHVLAKPDRYEWTLQGFGMLRTYVTKELRLHVWDERYRAPGVSDIHDHPWHFESLVLSGRIVNHRFYVIRQGVPTHYEGTIVCGPSTDVKTATIEGEIQLFAARPEEWGPGQLYTQRSEEVHRSEYDDGTVTLVRRAWTDRDPDHAKVYWRLGSTWISGHPRRATRGEVEKICETARERWKGP